MKRLVLALAMVAVASGPLFAGEKHVKQPPAATRPAEMPKRPLLDQMKTFSIRRDTGVATQPPATPPVRSGIEVNPWIVPSFN